MYAIEFKYCGFRSWYPPVIIHSLQKLIEPRKLLFIWEMLSKWNKMLFYIFTLYLAILEEYYSIIFLTVLISLFVIWRLCRVSNYTLWVSCKERNADRLCIIYKIYGQVMNIFPNSPFCSICSMPSNRWHEGRL